MTGRRQGREALLWAAGVFWLQALLLLPLLDIYLSTLQDEGLVAAHAGRVALGQAPFRDYYTRFMPGTDWALGLCFRLLGQHLWVLRGYLIVSVSLLAASLEWFSCRILPRRWSELPALLFLCVGAQVWPVVSFHWDAGLTAMLALCALYDRRDFLCGLLCGLTVLFLQTKGLAVCLGIGLTLLPQPRRLLRVVGGAAVPGALFVGWLLALGIFPSFWQQTVVYSTTSYVASQSVPFSLEPIVQELSALGQGLAAFTPSLAWTHWFVISLAMTAVDGIKFAGYYPVLLAGVIWLLWRRTRLEEAVIALILVLALASLFDLARPNRYRLNLQSPLWNPLLVCLIYRAPRRGVLAGCVLVPFLVHGADNVLSWSDYRYPVLFPRGAVRCQTPGLAAVLNDLSGQVQGAAPADTPMLGFSEVPFLMWMLGHPNPTRLDEVLPLITPPPEVELCSREVAGADLILFSPLDPRLSGDYPRLSPAEVAAEQERLRQLLTRGCQLVVDRPLYQVYVRSKR